MLETQLQKYDNVNKDSLKVIDTYLFALIGIYDRKQKNDKRNWHLFPAGILSCSRNDRIDITVHLHISSSIQLLKKLMNTNFLNVLIFNLYSLSADIQNIMSWNL